MAEPTKTENENCLAGMKCPKCGSLGPFGIAITRVVDVHDDGTNEDGGDSEWNDDSSCTCRGCNYSGTVQDFKEGVLTEEELVSIGYQFNDDPDTAGHTYFMSPLGEGSESYYHKADAIRAAAADAKATHVLSRCDNCGKLHTEEGLDYAADQNERTEPGGIIPSGQCVSCGSLCYPIE